MRKILFEIVMNCIAVILVIAAELYIHEPTLLNILIVLISVVIYRIIDYVLSREIYERK